jgi:hypothetical protein
MTVTEADLNYLRAIGRHINDLRTSVPERILNDQFGKGNEVLTGNIMWIEHFILRLGSGATIPNDAYDAYWQGHRDGQMCTIASNEDLKRAIKVLSDQIQAFHAKERAA